MDEKAFWVIHRPVGDVSGDHGLSLGHCPGAGGLEADP